ncbi:MAG TPA: cardiolipin synthase [Roseiflexaceae bacterium]|nr:cardiolipin synthase [Roseiflexaceae bacterium]
MNWNLIIIIAGVLSYLIGIVALFIVPANRKPGEATAWLMLIFLAPFLGVILFLLLGSPKLSRQRRAQQRNMDDWFQRLLADARQIPALRPVVEPPVPARAEPFVRLIANLGGLPPSAGNTVELLSDYQGAVDRIVADIDNAQQYVNVEYFAFADDSTGGRVVDALIRAHERGVTCRVLIDQMGNFGMNRPILKRLRDSGIAAHNMLPLRPFENQWNRPDLRNHRKLVVVDGTIGFTGSQNLIDDHYHKSSNIRKGLYYIEVVARVTGPGVQQLNAAFITDWYAETGERPEVTITPDAHSIPQATGDVLCQVLPSGPGFENENNLKLFVALFHAARQRITLANPYIVPDYSIMLALTSAALRGVEVTLITSEIGDQFMVYHAQRSYYEQLLKAGVKIYRYRSPVMLHSKILSIDDDIAVIGSSNMDIRSFQLSLEVTLICYDTTVVADMHNVFADYLQHSRPIRLDEWQARPLHTKLFDNLARLTSALQ